MGLSLVFSTSALDFQQVQLVIQNFKAYCGITSQSIQDGDLLVKHNCLSK